MAGEITVISRSFDQSVRRTWTCRLLEANAEIIVAEGAFDIDVEHPDLGFIKRGTISTEYYWPERWYNVFRFHNPDGSFRNFYCNIAMPPRFAECVLDYVDLDIDVIVWPDGRAATLDEDDFKRNVGIFRYPQDVCDRAARALDELLAMIAGREFPFEL